MKSIGLWLSVIFISIAIFSCKKGSNVFSTETNNSKVLAKVYDKKLYADDLEGILPVKYKSEDSTMIYNAYIENWLRDAVLMREAESKIAQNLDIEQLVKDYRSTLILHNYEKIIVETQLDSIITESDVNSFYEENKENYHLKNPMLRALYIKVPKNANELAQLDKWWNSEDIDDRLHMIEYCNTYAENYLLDKEKWHDLEKIRSTLPTKLVNNSTLIQVGTDINRSDDLYKYYLRVLEVIQANEAPPMDYLKGKAKQVILQRRKSKLLEDHRENIYNKEINNSNVKVYTQ